MIKDKYYPGDRAILSGTFTRPPDWDLFDPEIVRFKYRGPGAEDWTTLVYGTDAGVTRISLGVFWATLDLPDPGDWVYRWEIDGTRKGVEEGRIKVLISGKGV